MNRNFYQVFLEECEKWIDDDMNINITEQQKESIEDATFFNQIDEEFFSNIALSLILSLNFYNGALDGKSIEMSWVTKENQKKKLNQSINTTKNFIKMLEDETLAIPGMHEEFGLMDEMRAELTEKSKFILKMMQSKMMMFRKKPKSSKTMFRNLVYKICEEYSIPKGREVKKFIDKLDEYK